MNINSINPLTHMTKGISFGNTAIPYPEYQKANNISFRHTAVPYPEYENAYYTQNQPQVVSRVIEKISALFTPEVTQKSQEIKNGINKIYEAGKQKPEFSGNPKKQLLSVLA